MTAAVEREVAVGASGPLATLELATAAVVRDVLGPTNDVVGPWRPTADGRWSSPAPVRLAAATGMPLVPLADRLAAALRARLGQPGGERAPDAWGEVAVSATGFLLVTPGRGVLREVLVTVLGAGRAYARPHGSVPSLVMDPAVPVRRTRDSRLFVVMWAHARCCVVLDRVETVTASEAPGTPGTAGVPERVLVLLLADLPRALTAAGDDPTAVLRRLHEVAGATHQWLDRLDPLGVPQRRAPEWWAAIEATRQVLATGLDVLGVSAPTRL